MTWDRLAEICGQYLGKSQLVNIEGRIQTRQWEDDTKQHWKTEIVASAAGRQLPPTAASSYPDEAVGITLACDQARSG